MFAKLILLLTLAAGPWVTDMHKDGFSVVWTSGDDCTGFVQLADGQRFYEEYAGRKVHGRFHEVRLTGLKEGSSVSYMIGCRPLLDNSNPRRPKYGDEVLSGPYAVRTFTGSGNSCRFSIFNDQHMNIRRYSTLASQVDTAVTDFIFLNGDLISAGHHSTDSLAKYEISPLGRKASILPVMFARGNHEGRGDGIRNVAKLFSRSGELPFTYMFREGPAAFVVFDAGETGVKNSLAFCGDTVYTDYLNRQMAWAAEAFKSPEWRSAKVRICLLHVPMVDLGIPHDYVVHAWMNHNIVPMLNKAGVNLMIGADLHEYLYVPVGGMGNSFPILVNDNNSRAEVIVEGSRIEVDMFDVNGYVSHSHEF